MTYFGGTQGRGDPGFFGSLFGRVKKGVGGFLARGPIGIASAFTAPGRGAISAVTGLFSGPVVTGSGTRATAAAAGEAPKRRRMNVTNDKALRRAIRRQAGFVKLAKKALKGTGFQIVSSASLARSRGSKAAAAERHHAE